MKYFVRPECGVENRWGPTLGPFDDFLQITYSTLRVGPDGDEIATFDVKLGEWWFEKNIHTTHYNPEYNNVDPTNRGFKDVPVPIHSTKDSFGCTKPWYELWWSDLVIFAKEE